jgi:DNA-binding GntR family transcriptional regulator
MSGYEALREAIVRGEIGADARLVENEVSTRFAMPRGAVRTALVRLEQEGLVVREPNRGARVRRIGGEEAVEILEARAALEGLAARKAAQRIDAIGTARLNTCLRRHGELLESGDLLAASDANADLHATLLEISGHRTAQQLIRGLRSQTVRFQFRTILVPGRPDASHAEHRAIVEAVTGGHPKRAERAMREHLLNVADALRGAVTPRP